MSDQQGPSGVGVLSVETPESVAFAFELAGVGSRGLAFFLDSLILAALVIAEALIAWLSWYLLARISDSLAARLAPWILGAAAVTAFLTVWGYFVFGEVARNGRTIGKRRLGLRVIRDDGSRVTFIDSAIRNILRLVDALPGSFAVGVASIVLSARHKRVGDMAAGTVVVRDTGELVLHTDGSDHSEAVAVAREFLSRRGRLTPEARWQVAVAVLAAFGESPAPGWDEPTVAGRIADLSGWRTT